MKFLIVFICLLIWDTGFTQTNFRYGFELGTSITSLPIVKKSSKFNSTSVRKVMPVVGPIVGVKSQLNLKKHLYISLGLHYQTAGVKKQYKSEGSSPDFYPEESFYTFEYETIDKKVYHKVDVPLVVGYRFRVNSKIQPSLFIGYSPNFYLYGKHYRKYYTVRSNNHNNYDVESTHNPLDTEKNYKAVKRYHKQTTIGISTLINQKIKLDLSFNYGRTFTYNIHKPIGFCGTANYAGTSFKGSDLGFSLTYFLR